MMGNSKEITDSKLSTKVTFGQDLNLNTIYTFTNFYGSVLSFVCLSVHVSVTLQNTS